MYILSGKMKYLRDKLELLTIQMFQYLFFIYKKVCLSRAMLQTKMKKDQSL